MTLFILTAIIAVFIDSQSLASATDLNNIYKAPFENSDYLLGTDDLGRSVFYGLINGAKITLFIAIITSVLSLVIGLLFAFVAAYYGNDKLKLNWLSIIGLGIITFVCLFYFIYSSHKLLFFSAWLLSILGAFFINRRSSKIKTGIKIPVDTLILKFLEILKTLPGIFIVDEPELSLHLGWQEIFVRSITEASPKTQFILATHSPTIVGSVENEKYCLDIAG